MADELNIPTHRWYQKRNHVALAKEDVSRQYIYDSGIQKIDAWINSQPWGNPIPPLFANDEAGVWYDPSDRTTLFQDTAGTTPVTTSGQTVGLMLDKSQGLVLGPEEFEAASTSETSGVVQDGTSNDWTMTSAPANNSAIAYNAGFSSNAGKTYSVGFEVYDYVSGSVVSRVQGVNGPTASANGTYEYKHLAVGAGDFIGVAILLNATLKVRNISVRELPGYHATQPTAAARPTYQTDGTLHWLEFDGVDDFMVTPTITPGAGLSAQFFAGVNVATPKSNNSPVYQYGDATFSSTDALLKFVTGDGSTDAYRAQVFGSGSNQTARVTAVAPYTSAFSVLCDASAVGADEISLRENGSVTAVGSATDSGLTSFGNSQMWIGSNQSGSVNFFGNIYGLVTRFGANLETATIETTETYVAGKTGVTL